MGINQAVPCKSSQIAEPLNTHPLGHGDEMVLNATPIQQDVMGGVETDNSLDLSLNHYHLNDYNNNASSVRAGTFTSTTARLTSLNMALYECASKLSSIKPSQSVRDPCVIDSNTRMAALFSLDEVFYVTSQFIDVMRDLLLTTDCHETSTLTTATRAITVSPYLLQGADSAFQSHLTHPLLGFEPSLYAEASSSSGTDSFSHLDEATMLLFLSCHCRLTEIYESIFEAIQRCIKSSPAAAFDSTAGVVLPQLHVGGFGGVSSPALRVDFSGPRLTPATISMYMSLVTMMSAQLWAQMGEALRQRKVRYESSQAPMVHLGVTGVAWNMAMARIDNMSQTISSVQRLL